VPPTPSLLLPLHLSLPQSLFSLLQPPFYLLLLYHPRLFLSLSLYKMLIQ
jgi:hypothetical protein